MSNEVKTRYLSVIIPVFNEEVSLPKVINDLPKELINEIIVVDNKSTDQTAAVARQLGCTVVYEPVKGYGQACLTGMAALSSKTDIVVFVDGDYSDHSDQLPELIKPILEDKYDFVIGSRILGVREKNAMTPQAFYGNKLACFLMKLFWKTQYTDLGPFRAISYNSLKKLNMCDQNFGWTIEMQIKAAQKKLRIVEVPVNYRCRIGKSKIAGTLSGTLLAGEKILRTIFKYKFMG